MGRGRKEGGSRRHTLPRREVLSFFRDLVSDREVQEAMRDQVLACGEGAALLFLAAVAHVEGQPTQRVELEVTPGIATLITRAIRPAASPRRQRRRQARGGVAAAPPR
jgi:hypothetical protein